MRKLLVLLALFAVAACGSVPMAPPSADAAGKRFEPPPTGQGAIYVVRRPSALGIGAPVPVTVGPNQVGSLVGNTWLRLDLPPGRYDVRHQSEDNTSSVIVDLVAGQTVFVSMTWTGAAFFRMEIVPPEVGRPIVLAGQRALEIR